MSRRTIWGMLCVLIALGFTAPCFAAVLEVPLTFGTIQAAITASSNLDEIQVAPGTYLENLDFQGKAITLISTGGAESTIIDGSTLTRGALEGSTLILSSGEAAATIIDGFTVTGGTGRLQPVLSAGGSLLGSFRVGGGALALGSNPTIRNCIFTGNDAQFGSGVFSEGGGGASITSCLFSANTGLQGSGVYLRLLLGLSAISNCQFVGNSANTAGGGLMLESAGSLITSCSFDGNDAILGGGALFQDSVVLMTGSSFTANHATLLGGGALVFNATATLQACNFTSNTGGTGAGIGCDGGTANLDRCLMASNAASGDGGAIALSANSVSLSLEGCTLTANTSLTAGGIFIPVSAPSTATVSNSIIWGNSGAAILDGGQTTATFSDITGAPVGTGNIDVDPIFAAPLAGDFTLMPLSPAIDAGNPVSSFDPDSTVRDMGALFFDQRPDQIAPIDCVLLDLCDSSFTVTWTVSDFYDSIDLNVDGSTIATLPGTAVSADVQLGSAGAHQICLTPTFAGLVGQPTCCQANAPTIPTPLAVAGLTCTVDQPTCTALATWTNADAYASIEILLNGLTFATLPGTETSFPVPVGNGVLTEITVTGTATCGGLPVPAATCFSGCNIDFAPFQRGDANTDGALDISDPLSVLSYMFLAATLPCEDAGDANDDGALDLTDATSLLATIFAGSPFPGAPSLGACGTDPSFGDALNCASYPSCP